MARTLPDARYITEDVRLVSSRNDQKSATGANRQRVARKGSHYLAVFVCEPMTLEDAREWRRLETEHETVVAQLEQPGLDAGAPGAVLVDGAGQAGASLDVKGLTPQYPVREGQMLVHVSASGVRRIYIADEEVVAGAGGLATIPLKTMLLAPPADGDVVDLVNLTIEGFAMLEEGSFLIDGDGFVTIRFTVEEPG